MEAKKNEETSYWDDYWEGGFRTDISTFRSAVVNTFLVAEGAFDAVDVFSYRGVKAQLKQLENLIKIVRDQAQAFVPKFDEAATAAKGLTHQLPAHLQNSYLKVLTELAHLEKQWEQLIAMMGRMPIISKGKEFVAILEKFNVSKIMNVGKTSVLAVLDLICEMTDALSKMVGYLWACLAVGYEDYQIQLEDATDVGKAFVAMAIAAVLISIGIIAGSVTALILLAVGLVVAAIELATKTDILTEKVYWVFDKVISPFVQDFLAMMHGPSRNRVAEISALAHIHTQAQRNKKSIPTPANPRTRLVVV